MICDNTVGCQGEGEKTDTTDFLSGPTMWLGAQDGRYGIPSPLSAFWTHFMDLITLYSSRCCRDVIDLIFRIIVTTKHFIT